MRRIVLALFLACAGCASGAPATIDRAAPSTAVVATNRLGFRPEVQATLAIPVDVLACVTETGTNVLRDVVQGVRCILNTAVPIVTESAAPAYSASPCAPAYVDEQVTEYVPETSTRMVPRTRTIRRAVPQAPAAPAPCAPMPQAPAPRSGCEPPPSPVCAGPNCRLGGR